jgi:hypothetical protein
LNKQKAILASVCMPVAQFLRNSITRESLRYNHVAELACIDSRESEERLHQYSRVSQYVYLTIAEEAKQGVGKPGRVEIGQCAPGEFRKDIIAFGVVQFVQIRGTSSALEVQVGRRWDKKEGS